MFGPDYELIEAAPKKDCDYQIAPETIRDEEDEADTHPCWTADDEPFLMVVSDTAPEQALGVIEAEGWETMWASEVQREPVKVVETGVREETAYYVEEPPAERYESVGRRRALELLENRGRESDVAELEDSWYYPAREEFVALYTSVDAQDEVSRVVWRSDDLSGREKELLLDGEPLEGGEEEMRREEIAQIIEENSPIYPREADIASCWIEGIVDYQQIVREIGPDKVTYQSVTQSIYNFRDRSHAVAWAIKHVWPEIPEQHRTDAMEDIIDAVEAKEVRDPSFNAVGKGRGK